MSNWRVGMKVVCVERPKQYAHGPNLTVGQTYTVKSIHTCVCGSLTLDVGLYTPTGETRCSCGLLNPGRLHWARRFRPLDNLEQQLERIASEGAEEDVPQLQEA